MGDFFRPIFQTIFSSSQGYPQQKVFQCQEFSGMGCVMIFWVEGKKKKKKKKHGLRGFFIINILHLSVSKKKLDPLIKYIFFMIDQGMPDVLIVGYPVYPIQKYMLQL